MTEGEVNEIAPNNSTLASALSQELSNGDLTGYIRVWTPEPADGDVVVIAAFQWKDAEHAQGFLAGETAAGKRQSTFPVPGIAFAFGYSLSASVSGVTYTSMIVTFVKGDIAFQVDLLTPSTGGDLTRTEAVSVAVQQAENAPGASLPPSTASDATPLSYVVGEVLGGVLIGSLIIGAIFIVIRREGRRPPAGVAPMAPQFGWYPVGGVLHDQAFWDGYRWTARRRWDGVRWNDVPLDS